MGRTLNDGIGLLDDHESISGKLPGARGAAAQRLRQRQLQEDPQAVSRAVRLNRDEQLDGSSGVTRSFGGRTKTYLVQEVPFNRARAATYAAFGMAEVFDLMEQGQWHAAEARTALLLVAFDQAAMDDWKWHRATKLALLREPPFHHLLEVQGSSLAESVSHLADAEWVSAAVAYAKDITLFNDRKETSG